MNSEVTETTVFSDREGQESEQLKGGSVRRKVEHRNSRALFATPRRLLGEMPLH